MRREVSLADVKGKWPDSTMDEFRDDMTGPVSKQDFGKAPTRDEMDFLAKLNGCREHNAREKATTAWNVNKWLSTKEIRSDSGCGACWWCKRRICNVHSQHMGAVFAASPMLECFRLLCRSVMSSDVNQVLSQIRAHFEGTLSHRDHEEGVYPMA